MINTAQATKAELAAYLKDEHGIGLPSNAVRAELVSKVQELEGITSENPVGDNQSESDTPEKRLTHVTINIHKGSTPEEQGDVNPICNGVGYQIQRGHDVKVPVIVYNVLRDAQRTLYTAKRDANNALVNEPSQVMRFPFSVVDKHYSNK